MNMHYQPIPEDLDEIYLNPFSCDQDCCGAIFFTIMARTKSNRPIELWQSPSFFYLESSKEELDEFRKTMQEAIDYYKLDVDLDSDCVFDWE